MRDLLPKRYQVPLKYWYSWLRGGLEEEMKFLDLVVKPQDRVIDVGGNRGIYAYRLWRLGAYVDVFEPHSACLSVLTAWQSGKMNVQVHPFALSSRIGTSSLYIPVDRLGVEHDASASIEGKTFERVREEVVPLRTLDGFGFEGVRLIKIDVEGHERSVIEGARATISACRPALLVEIEQRHIDTPIDEVFLMVQKLGYRGFFVEGGSITAIEKFNTQTHQSIANFHEGSRKYINNFLFLHCDLIAEGEYDVIADGLPLR